MLDVLTKFDQVEVKPESRISLSDKKFCENIQCDLDEVVSFTAGYNQYIEDNKVKNSLYNNSGLIDNMNTVLKNAKESAIREIVYHFAQTYNVRLESGDIRYKLKDKETIHYTDVLEEIFEELGGVSFTDRAVAEIKEDAKNSVSGRLQTITIKNKKLTTERVAWWRENFNGVMELSYSDKDVHSLLKALSHFMTDSTSGLTYNLSSYYRLLRNGERETAEVKFKKYVVSTQKVLSLKVFKNGKLEIEFETPEIAKEFAKEYLGFAN